jgi:spore coat protein U-like protein
MLRFAFHRMALRHPAAILRRAARALSSALAALGLTSQILAGALVALPLLVIPATPARATCSITQPSASITLSGDMLGTEQWVPFTQTYACTGLSAGTTQVCYGETSATTENNRAYINGNSSSSSSIVLDSRLYLTPSGTLVPHDATQIPTTLVYGTSDSNSTQTLTSYAHILATTAPVGTAAGTYSFPTPSNWNIGAERTTTCGTTTVIAGSNALGSIALSVIVLPVCTLNSTPAIDFGLFGSLGALATDRTASGGISVTCPNGTPYTIYLGDGANRASAGSGTRNMANGDERLSYQIYKASDLAAVWDETGMGAGVTGGTGGVSKTATGGADVTTAYAAIRAGTTLPATLGAYSDTVVVTVAY